MLSLAINHLMIQQLQNLYFNNVRVITENFQKSPGLFL